MDLVAGVNLLRGEHLVVGEQADVFLGDVIRQRVRRGAQIQKPARLGLTHPGVVIAVAVEDDAFCLHDDLVDQLMQGAVEILRRLEAVGELPQLLGHDRIERHVRPGDRLRRAGHTELELVARERERRRAVAVGRVLRKPGQHAHAHLEGLLFAADEFLLVGDGLQNGVKLVADVDGHDGRRGLVRAEAVVVAGPGDRHAQKILIVVDGLQHRAQKQQKLRVLPRRVARLEKILAGIRRERPVVVLAGAVHAGEGLFVQKALHAVLAGDAAHQLHRELVVVGGDVHGAEHRRKLVLTGGDLVVLGLRDDAELPQLVVQLLHEVVYAFFDRAEIVVVELLTLGRAGAEQRAAGVDEILAPLEHLAVDQKILLLRPGGGADLLHGRIAEQPQDADGLFGQRLHRPQKRRLLVERRAGVGGERGRDAEHAVLHKRVARRIPGGVASGLERRPQTAGRKARSVRLALYKLLAGELHDRPAVAGRVDEAVVLLGGDAGHRLEPVRVMRGALLDGPVLHRVRDDGGDLGGQPLVVVDGVYDLLVRLVRQTGLHHGLGKYHGTEDLGDIAHILYSPSYPACAVYASEHDSAGTITVWDDFDMTVPENRRNGTGARKHIRDAIAVSAMPFYPTRPALSIGREPVNRTNIPAAPARFQAVSRTCDILARRLTKHPG